MKLGDFPWRLLVRVLTAIVGGYALASLFATALALELLALTSMPRLEAVRAGALASFLVYAVAIMAIIHSRSITRAWVWLSLGGLVCLLIIGIGK
ncbi:iron transporter [Azorhizophilus paspali]|uniref:Iron transporter n=1 Tax=Azorhizophilus paspali TaxID=69963 RepID=A0ABV6SJG3_AZOPA